MGFCGPIRWIGGVSCSTNSGGWPQRVLLCLLSDTTYGTLHGLETNEKAERAEKFAMVSLLYEIMTSSKPFLSVDEVQKRFTKGDFPEDAATLPLSLFILSGWSKEFPQEVARTSMFRCSMYAETL